MCQDLVMTGFPERAWMLKFDGESFAHIVFTFRVWHEDDSWQGLCSELGVPSFGDNPGDALSNVIDATVTYLNAIEAVGDRETVFRDRGVILEDGLPGEKESIQEQVEPNVSLSRLELTLAECG